MSEIKNTPNRLQVQYKETVVPELMKKYGYKSVMEAPKLVKVVINIGVGDATSNSKLMEESVKELTAIADSIRSKTGDTELMYVSEMPGEINEIKSNEFPEITEEDEGKMLQVVNQEWTLVEVVNGNTTLFYPDGNEVDY